MKYTVEEVRNAARLLDGLSRRMLIDYAERIKADESAWQPVAEVYEYPRELQTWNSPMLRAVRFLGASPLPIGAKLFAHPPAQAAQGEASLGRCQACGRTTRAVCDGLDGNGLGCTNAPPPSRPTDDLP